ncbi:alginate O-acetyltransferase AlgX-related protein [Methylobacterium sp. J-068]|uniref:alginate O-acetyltransferase AlgX-related protein n=1 Tax=Methylobacterium sp. J-068 TaxID=2836649 RepID=UPI001FBA1C10|nr:hypothetical protein [Methylobacterium sp. J-068]MCJ2036670.1 hypothetical protein [Methylobacterium sp. J-068]
MIDLKTYFSTQIEGRNGQLFYTGADGAANLLTYYTAGIMPDAVRSWRATFARRGRELAKRGIPYHVIIVPGAHVACGDDLPDALRGTIKAPFPELAAAMEGVAGVTLHDALPDLVVDDPPYRTYRRNDTHWTDYGAYLSYRAVCRRVAQDVAVRLVAPEDFSVEVKNAFGDLSIHRVPEGAPEPIPLLKIGRRHRARVVQKTTTVVRNRFIRMESDTAPDTSAFFFHDSYATAQAKFWARSFGRTFFAGVSHRVYLDAIDRYRPDVVFSIMAEHRLFQKPNDHDHWTFADDFESDCASPAGVRAAELLVLYRQQKLAEAARAASGIEDLAGFGAYHARVAAQILVSVHRYDEALAMSRTALSLDPQSPSHLWMAAYASLYAGRADEAVTLATWAVGKDPLNGAWAELLASALIGLGRWDDAALLLENTVPGLDDHPGLWRHLAHVRDRRGDREGRDHARAMAAALDGAEARLAS